MKSTLVLGMLATCYSRTYPHNSEKGFKGIRMNSMWYWVLSLVASLFMCVAGFIKSNPEETLGIQRVHPLMWWLVVGGFTTYIGMTNWIFVKSQIGPLKGLVFFTIFQVIFDVVVYSWYFGWQPKYVIAVLLVAIAGAIVAS